ncbi:MAG: hypothetical protein AAF600_21505 [Bacteroidota bacterium]
MSFFAEAFTLFHEHISAWEVNKGFSKEVHQLNYDSMLKDLEQQGYAMYSRFFEISNSAGKHTIHSPQLPDFHCKINH